MQIRSQGSSKYTIAHYDFGQAVTPSNLLDWSSHNIPAVDSVLDVGSAFCYTFLGMPGMTYERFYFVSVEQIYKGRSPRKLFIVSYRIVSYVVVLSELGGPAPPFPDRLNLTSKHFLLLNFRSHQNQSQNTFRPPKWAKTNIGKYRKLEKVVIRRGSETSVPKTKTKFGLGVACGVWGFAIEDRQNRWILPCSYTPWLKALQPQPPFLRASSVEWVGPTCQLCELHNLFYFAGVMQIDRVTLYHRVSQSPRERDEWRPTHWDSSGPAEHPAHRVDASEESCVVLTVFGFIQGDERDCSGGY